jgi:type I restriction enzyme S subunit
MRPYFRKLAQPDFDGVCSTEFCVIKPKIESDRKYLFYSAAHKNFIDYATSNSKGDRPRTKWKYLADYSLKLPPPEYREKIGSVLSIYDEAIRNNNKRINLLEESARLLYKEWFIRLRFPGYEHTKITKGVPEGWGKKPLGNSIVLNYGKALKAEIRAEGDVPVFGSSGIVGRHDKPFVNGAGIVVGRKGNVGSVYWSSKPFYPIDTVYYVDPEQSDLYLYYALQHMHFISTDVAVPGLNRDFAYSRHLMTPRKETLRLFLDYIEPIHQQIDNLQEMNDKLRAATDLLLPKLMSGEIAV